MLLNNLSEIVVLDFRDETHDLRMQRSEVAKHFKGNQAAEALSDPYSIIVGMMPCFDNLYAAETFFNAAVYEFWNKHPNVDSAWMEKFTDQILKLCGKVLDKMDKLNMYNQEGELMYTFESRLGDGIVMRLKALKPDQYQVF